jgi:hypothetical protein
LFVHSITIYKEVSFNECRGTYIHPLLAHFVADFCNLEYSDAVGRIMYNTNIINELKCQTLEDTARNQEIYIEELKKEKEVLEQKKIQIEQEKASAEGRIYRLITKVVPEKYKDRYSYLVYQLPQREMERCKIIEKEHYVIYRAIRRETKNLTFSQKCIIGQKIYLYYRGNLPISISVNKYVIDECESKIDGFYAIRTLMYVPETI